MIFLGGGKTFWIYGLFWAPTFLIRIKKCPFERKKGGPQHLKKGGGGGVNSFSLFSRPKIFKKFFCNPPLGGEIVWKKKAQNFFFKKGWKNYFVFWLSSKKRKISASENFLKFGNRFFFY